MIKISGLCKPVKRTKHFSEVIYRTCYSKIPNILHIKQYHVSTFFYVKTDWLKHLHGKYKKLLSYKFIPIFNNQANWCENICNPYNTSVAAHWDNIWQSSVLQVPCSAKQLQVMLTRHSFISDCQGLIMGWGILSQVTFFGDYPRFSKSSEQKNLAHNFLNSTLESKPINIQNISTVILDGNWEDHVWLDWNPKHLSTPC